MGSRAGLSHELDIPLGLPDFKSAGHAEGLMNQDTSKFSKREGENLEKVCTGHDMSSRCSLVRLPNTCLTHLVVCGLAPKADISENKRNKHFVQTNMQKLLGKLAVKLKPV